MVYKKLKTFVFVYEWKITGRTLEDAKDQLLTEFENGFHFDDYDRIDKKQPTKTEIKNYYESVESLRDFCQNNLKPEGDKTEFKKDLGLIQELTDEIEELKK